MHKQYHLKGHPTFTHRKGKTYYYHRKIPQDLAVPGILDILIALSYGVNPLALAALPQPV